MYDSDPTTFLSSPAAILLLVCVPRAQIGRSVARVSRPSDVTHVAPFRIDRDPKDVVPRR